MRSVFILVFLLCSSSALLSQELNVELNEGEKWKANQETTDGIKAMQDKVSAFENNQTQSGMELHLALLNDFQMIFAKCTMKGNAHEQLHNYLIPLRSLLVPLQDCSKENCEDELPAVKSHLSAYHDYFE
ncbi:MAG: hypothetical protein WEC59_03660 [Salibacteraceae bacterium]